MCDGVLYTSLELFQRSSINDLGSTFRINKFENGVFDKRDLMSFSSENGLYVKYYVIHYLSLVN